MKYCSKCGAELLDDAVVCPNCGTSVENQDASIANAGKNRTLGKVAKVFLILTIVGCVLSAFSSILPILGGMPSDMTEEAWLLLKSASIGGFIGGLVPLAWVIPMTVVIFRKLRDNKRIGMGLKVCTLIFVNIISGILLLCMNDNNN